jgi:hypothetical protein
MLATIRGLPSARDLDRIDDVIATLAITVAERSAC